MNRPCNDCPFRNDGAGFRIRQSLAPGRWQQITRGVRLGQPFYCHKTTNWDVQDESGESYIPVGTEQLCAGAIEYLRQKRNAK